MPRYLIERNMPAGAVDSVTPEVLKSVQANNAVFGVTWIHTYMNRDKTKTFCIYEGPDEQNQDLCWNRLERFVIPELDGTLQSLVESITWPPPDLFADSCIVQD